MAGKEEAMEGRALARIGAIVFVAFAITATVIELTREEEPARSAPASPFAPSVDPLRAEQRR
jgi:conjugative transfer region protein TrbK